MNHAKKTRRTQSAESDIRILVLTLYSRFSPGFYLLEYSVKNRIFALINEELGKKWFTAQLDEKGNDPLFKAEIELILKRKPKNYKLSPEILVTESGLGLWVEFFNSRIYKLAKGRPIKIFANLPAHIKRADLYKRLVKIKDFRNLLVHSRIAIISDSSHFTYLDEIHDNFKVLHELLFWLGENPVFSLAQFEQEVKTIKSALG